MTEFRPAFQSVIRNRNLVQFSLCFYFRMGRFRKSPANRQESVDDSTYPHTDRRIGAPCRSSPLKCELANLTRPSDSIIRSQRPLPRFSSQWSRLPERRVCRIDHSARHSSDLVALIYSEKAGVDLRPFQRSFRSASECFQFCNFLQFYSSRLRSDSSWIVRLQNNDLRKRKGSWSRR